MYPTVWNYIGDLSSFYIYDLIDDEKTKNRLQQKVKRLRCEKGSLAHGIQDIHMEYQKELKTVFQSDVIEYFFSQYFSGLIKEYQNLILEEPSFLSEEDGQAAYWQRHMASMYWFYEGPFPKWIADFKYLVPENYLAIFFPFMHEKNTLPFIEALEWFMDLNLLNQRKLAERITPAPDQLESTVRKIQRWLNDGNIPNFASFIEDLSPILDDFPDEKQKQGIMITFYISIAFSRMYKKYLKEVFLFEIRGVTEKDGELFDKAYQEQQQRLFNESEDYRLSVLKPCMDLLDKVKTEEGSIDEKISSLISLLAEKEPLIEKYHAEVFVYFIKARIFYMHDNYEEAVENYQIAFDLGRYRIGRQIKVLICEFLHCCRKLGKKTQFKKVHDWQSFIIDQKDYQLLSFDVKPFEQVWKEFNHDSKYFVLTNFKSRRMYS